MKIAYVLLVLSLCNNIIAQQKAFTPKSGEIVFVKEISAADKARFIEAGKILKEQTTNDSRYGGKTVDTTAINMRLEEISKTIDEAVNDVEKRHHEFKGDKITSYQTTNDIMGTYYSIINVKTGLNRMIDKEDSAGKYINEQPYYRPYKKGTSFKIVENRKDIKKINGFDCFKVTATVTAPSNENDPSSLEISMRYDMWVTDKIKCLYHPVVRFKEVLEKYYPLEITETSDTFETSSVYTLSSFSLK